MKGKRTRELQAEVQVESDNESLEIDLYQTGTVKTLPPVIVYSTTTPHLPLHREAKGGHLMANYISSELKKQIEHIQRYFEMSSWATQCLKIIDQYLQMSFLEDDKHRQVSHLHQPFLPLR